MTSTAPVVSVCIATYNQERYIANCVSSAVGQITDFPIEILIGDDCSTDNTESEIRKLQTRWPDAVTCYRQTRNLGASDNLKSLIKQTRGRYIAHLDGDDMWLPGKLAAQVSFLEANPACVAVFTNAMVISNDDKLLGVFNNPQPEHFDLNYALERGNFLNHSSLLYRREVGNFMLETPEPFIDYFIALGLASQGRLGYLNTPYSIYRAGVAGSMTSATPRKVQELYWNAIVRIDLRSAAPSSVTGVVSNFWAQILNRSRADRDLAYAYAWAKRIRLELPELPREVWMLGIVSFARQVLKRGAAKVIASAIRPVRVWFFR